SGGRLMVYGTKEQGAAIRQIVDTLESQKRAPRETKVFDVGKLAEAQRILPLAQQLYRDQVSNNPNAGPADAQMARQANTGQLIVTRKPEHVKQIEVILDQLNTAKPKSDARDTRVYDLTTAHAMELARTVRSLYQEQAKSRFGNLPPDTMIMPDATANR